MRKRSRVGLMAAMLVGVVAPAVMADVTTEQSSSILVFPKVVADGTRDTIIQITNTSNSMVHAHCFYVNAAPVLANEPPGPGNPPQWVEIDFDIWLTKQQPTHWVVSEGRLVDPSDGRCQPQRFGFSAGGQGATAATIFDCNGAGFDPGRVPPQVEDFQGELKCVEVDASGAPLAGNHLKGEATIIAPDLCVPSPTSPGERVCESDIGQPVAVVCQSNADCFGNPGDVSKYNALGVFGLETLNDDPVLCLGGEPTDECPLGAEYNACPETWILNHFVQDVEDPVLGDGSFVETSITVVPCSQDFESQVPESVTIQIEVFDEFESPFSASTTVTCWAELELDDISNIFEGPPDGPLDRTFAQTRLRPSRATDSGFMVVASEEHYLENRFTVGVQGTADFNLVVEGERPGPDLIVIPADQLGL
jgi:hypothetical protein